jgi:ribulose kinase
VALPREENAVLLGSAVIAAVAAGGTALRGQLILSDFLTMNDAMSQMTATGTTFEPTKEDEVVLYHEAKHKVFLLQYEHQQMYKHLMKAFQ